MKKIITKPHLFFFGLAFVFILLGLYKKDITLDIAVYSTYFEFHADFWCYLSAIFFCLIGLNYFSLIWAKKTPKVWLTILHIFLQTISLIPFIYGIFSLNSDEKLTQINSFYFIDLDLAIAISFIIFLCSIFIHLISFFTSLFLKTK
ncbi:hypothetical protein SAMN05216503_1252 [Polaribacter sp. KT25b]|uniref:hypothetical protein n=1 Tax=Polaribacter sp. KT25b TaxID=1855336 RepID=UPI00087CE185|nr:hypothetical protein [Polaribacter sp. KT25b]SDR87924.1 hypothetical protein SAMN05216503_1252 [Polaribacter sp. KT25b]